MKRWIRYLSGNRTGHVVEVDDSVASSEIAVGMAEPCAPPAAPAATAAKPKGRKRKAAPVTKPKPRKRKAVPVTKPKPPRRKAAAASAVAPSMKHVGGGWWELSNGRRYKGRVKAARALKRLGG